MGEVPSPRRGRCVSPNQQRGVAKGMFQPRGLMRDGLRNSRRWRLLASEIALTPFASEAQTWISAVSGSWSEPARWTAMPVPAPSTVLFFSPTGAQTYTATDDVGGPFLLNAINFGGTSSGSITIAAGSLSMLRFAGAVPAINNISTSQITLGGRLSIPAGGMAINLTPGNNNVSTVAAVIGGAGNLSITNTGVGSVQLQARNTFTGNLSLTNTGVELGTQTSLGSGSVTFNGGTISTSLFVAPFGYGPVLPSFSNPI